MRQVNYMRQVNLPQDQLAREAHGGGEAHWALPSEEAGAKLLQEGALLLKAGLQAGLEEDRGGHAVERGFVVIDVAEVGLLIRFEAAREARQPQLRHQANRAARSGAGGCGAVEHR